MVRERWGRCRVGNFTRRVELFHPDEARRPEGESSYPLKKWLVTRRSPLDSLWHENCFLSPCGVVH